MHDFGTERECQGGVRNGRLWQGWQLAASAGVHLAKRCRLVAVLFDPTLVCRRVLFFLIAGYVDHLACGGLTPYGWLVLTALHRPRVTLSFTTPEILPLHVCWGTPQPLRNWRIGVGASQEPNISGDFVQLETDDLQTPMFIKEGYRCKL